jgi:hypothetical protein
LVETDENDGRIRSWGGVVAGAVAVGVELAAEGDAAGGAELVGF